MKAVYVTHVGNWSCSSSIHGIVWCGSGPCYWCNWGNEASTKASKGLYL